MHRAHGEQVLEQVAVLAVVRQLHVAIHATSEGILDHRDRLCLRLGALQKATVATLHLALRVACDLAELLVDEEHGVPGNLHVADDDASGVCLRHHDERVDPPRTVSRHSVLVPNEVVCFLHIFCVLSQKLLDKGEARFRLHELGEHVRGKQLLGAGALLTHKLQRFLRSRRILSEHLLAHLSSGLRSLLRVHTIDHEGSDEELEVSHVSLRVLLDPGPERLLRELLTQQLTERRLPVHAPHETRELDHRCLPLLPLRGVIDRRQTLIELLRLRLRIEHRREHGAKLIKRRALLGSTSAVRLHTDLVSVHPCRVLHRVKREHVHKLCTILLVVCHLHGDWRSIADALDHLPHRSRLCALPLHEAAVFADVLGFGVPDQPLTGRIRVLNLHSGHGDITNHDSLLQLVAHELELVHPCPSSWWTHSHRLSHNT
mmetsp:Transcript_27714/g.63597  ORF Transcript_27714/g.63597 Transcript_27714/m.63597 type:complete len:431 (+) Transcript_27714:1179-2471(+)